MLLVGLGNPGEKYQANRHNVGFITVQEILHRYSFPIWREKFKGLYTSGDIGGEKVHLLLPQTFMNLSGESVQACAQFFKIKPEDILVFHDELDLELGKVKFKTGGGHAGHNGLRSIIGQLGTPNFRRCRIGIGHPGRKELVTPWVLGNFSQDEVPEAIDMCQALGKIGDKYLTYDDGQLTSEYAKLRR